MKKCCYFKSTGTWDFGLICVLAQPSYSDKIYDLTFFFFKKRSYQFRVRIDLDCSFERRCSPHWTMDSFKFQHQEHSLSLPATFIIFFFFFFFRRGVALFDSVNGCFFRNSERKLLSPRRQSLASPIPKHKSWKAIRSLFPQLYSMGIECICSKSTQTKVSKHLFVGENTVNTISEVLFWINCIFSFFLWCFLFPQPTEESSLTSTTTQGLCCYRCHQFRNRVALKLHFENPFHLNC